MHIIIVHPQGLIAELWANWILQHYPNCHISRFATHAAALDNKRESIADICILDVASSRDDWCEFLDEASYRKIARKILTLVGDYDDCLMASLRASRLDAVVSLKEDGLTGMLKAVRYLLVGQSYISPFLKQTLFAEDAQSRSTLDGLTPMETLVLSSVGAGYSKTDIAAELRISPSTVQTHRKNIMRKLKVCREGELVAQAFRLGVTKASPHGLHRPGFELALSSRNRRRIKIAKPAENK